jgi:hypothetical protein
MFKRIENDPVVSVVAETAFWLPNHVKTNSNNTGNRRVFRIMEEGVKKFIGS